MGLNADHLGFVLFGSGRGVRFDHTLMIGRQELYIDPRRLRRLLAAIGIQLADKDARRVLEEEDGFAEPFFHLLGAAHVDSMDVSSYEQATIVHDLNGPVAPALRGRYSVVIDSGSLEHVFNVAQAFRNCLEMVQEGGYFISMGPGNNAMGHGFYQFSPELYFRILSPQNGFSIKRIVVKEMDSGAPWYEITDPAVVGHRVEWQPLGEAHVMVLAQKERTVEIFQPVPQQSDYVPQWVPDLAVRPEGVRPEVHHHVDFRSAYGSERSLRRFVWEPMPHRVKTAYRRVKRLFGVLGRALSHPNPACFTRLEM